MEQQWHDFAVREQSLDHDKSNKHEQDLVRLKKNTNLINEYIFLLLLHPKEESR